MRGISIAISQSLLNQVDSIRNAQYWCWWWLVLLVAGVGGCDQY